MKLSHLKNIIKEELKQLNEADNWVDINCCPEKDHYCICRATVVNGTANNCCTTDCNPVPCTSGYPEDDDRVVSRGGPRAPMGPSIG